MKSNYMWVVCAVSILSSCRPSPVVSKKDEPHKEALTHWTTKTELFLEYPPLTAGVKGRFAVHLTNLQTFKPVAAGRVEVTLTSQDGSAEVFTAAAPSRPGIFGVDVSPKHSGEVQMRISITSPGLTDRHDLGAVRVYADAKSAAHEDEPAKEETVAFLKEQQWALDFATEIIAERPAREVLRVPGEISPRVGGEAEVTAPFTGRLVSSASPPIGSAVEKGQLLAAIVSPASGPSEMPALELAKTEAEAALLLARKERQRAERLLSAGAGPARKVDEARFAEQTAEARIAAATARIAQYKASREASGYPATLTPFLLRAPIGGLITEAHAASGAQVESGAALFKIIDADTVYVSAMVPESELPRIAQFREAELEVPGGQVPRRLDRLVSVGRMVDPTTRTFRVIYEASNTGRSLAIGQTVFARLLGQRGKLQPAAPVSAVVDDGGRPVVFVQLEGEAFVRRPVKLGPVEGVYVQIAEGIKVGERIVSRGAYLIRLSAMSNQVPAHGHVH
ncbi:MAG: efflux RND transporter periplasmic adaptor subunit [Candidatus Solibacter usitatus]|nr:efflux RND transporter periplasmic adaptor subunit [Candidatus Solibacter usitatus]